MCDIAFSEDPFMLKYCFDRCKTEEIVIKLLVAGLLQIK